MSTCGRGRAFCFVSGAGALQRLLLMYRRGCPPSSSHSQRGALLFLFLFRLFLYWPENDLGIGRPYQLKLLLLLGEAEEEELHYDDG